MLSFRNFRKASKCWSIGKIKEIPSERTIEEDEKDEERQIETKWDISSYIYRNLPNFYGMDSRGGIAFKWRNHVSITFLRIWSRSKYYRGDQHRDSS